MKWLVRPVFVKLVPARINSARSSTARGHLAEFRILPQEQITDGFSHPQGERASSLMLPSAVQQVATLAEGFQIAPPVVAGVVVEMPKLGTLEAGEAASLAGPAPIARQSGRWTGRSFIRAGRAGLRKALYMPALVAMRFHRQLVDAGKPAKVAIAAIMRKLIVLANALLKANRTWKPKAP